MSKETQLTDWRDKALQFEQQINQVVIGLQPAVRNIILAVFARGHVLLEGNVGVGKTTLLRAVAQGLGGDYQRIEGTIDLMPADLIYYTYLNSEGRPCVDPGPLLKHGDTLATFFFNEINRARPQVHALLLRAMAERSINAFNQDYALPHMQVFADRNRVEREETFELPAAAKDRFMMEINIDMPNSDAVLDELMFNPRFHDTDQLIGNMSNNRFYYQLNDLAQTLQQHIQTSPKLRAYALTLWKATHQPQHYGVQLSDVEMPQLLMAGASPRGMSYLIRAAKTRAWLEHRNHVLPEDLQGVFSVCMTHRLFLNPMYAYRKEQLLPELITGILNQVAAP
ncbi:MoxR family ATPase [Methylobacter sp. S3L5C]|uniref:AAA family ATPase n=1 Tax=Methylobacter sp. S3L5C TaxID=2839024 RepID=UPI001FAC7395|nr:MoxR family ATPase [Methylobacter sp. S3L5C]UOA07015.1 MoxR family ATPase [Methylobacter sp. S3L5C]